MPIIDLKCPYCHHISQIEDPIEEECIECPACDEFFTPEEAAETIDSIERQHRLGTMEDDSEN